MLRSIEKTTRRATQTRLGPESKDFHGIWTLLLFKRSVGPIEPVKTALRLVSTVLERAILSFDPLNSGLRWTHI